MAREECQTPLAYHPRGASLGVALTSHTTLATPLEGREEGGSRLRREQVWWQWYPQNLNLLPGPNLPSWVPCASSVTGAGLSGTTG